MNSATSIVHVPIFGFADVVHYKTKETEKNDMLIFSASSFCSNLFAQTFLYAIDANNIPYRTTEGVMMTISNDAGSRAFSRGRKNIKGMIAKKMKDTNMTRIATTSWRRIEPAPSNTVCGFQRLIDSKLPFLNRHRDGKQKKITRT